MSNTNLIKNWNFNNTYVDLPNSLYSKFEEGDSSFNDKYFDLLKSGGSIDYKTHLQNFDLNPKDKNFWQLGMNLIKNLMDELEELG